MSPRPDGPGGETVGPPQRPEPAKPTGTASGAGDRTAGPARPDAAAGNEGAGNQGAGNEGAGNEGAGEDVVDAAAEAVELEFDAILSVAQRERDEYLDMLRRVQADFENYKKRMMRQQTDHLERAAEDMVTKILPVLDAFDLARAHLGEGDDASAEGKALLAASGLLADTLAKEGLERIDDPGAPFDPSVHEAVDRVPDGAGPAGQGSSGEGPVVDGVLRAGYRWKGRVIRPAMVRVRG